MSETVCGYCNFETFTVAMFLSSNRPQHDQCMNLAEMALAKGVNLPGSDFSGEGEVWLEEELQTLVAEGYLSMTPREEEASRHSGLRYDRETLANELLGAALERVNWRELAAEWIATVRERA